MADTWEAKQSLPTSRVGPAGSGVIADLLYVAGGTEGVSTFVKTTRQYTPGSDSWALVADMPATTSWRDSGAAVISGKMYIANGVKDGARTKAGAYYQPDSWTAIADAITARSGACACEHGGKMYVFGGDVSGPVVTAIVEEYTPGSDTWASKTSMPTARGWTAAASDGGSYIYVIGGRTTGGGPGGALAILERYNVTGDSWATMTSMPTARSATSVAFLGGYLYVAGGRISSGDGSNKMERYDPSTDSWATMTSMATNGRGNAGFGVIGGQYLHVAGGWTTGATTLHHRYVLVDIGGWTVTAQIL